MENDIEKFKEEVAKLECYLHQHKCRKKATQQHCHQVDQGTSSHIVRQHEVPIPTAVEDIAVSLDDLLSELQDNDRWCEELQNFM